MYRLVSAVLIVADVLLLRIPALTPRICDGCGRTWRRLTPTQCTAIGARRLPACRRWTCDGRLWPLTDTGTTRLIEDLRNRTAAPGWTPGTAEPNGWKEPKDMHTLIAEDTPRGRQIAAALTLARLLELGLPGAEWRITDDGHLYGHVNLPGHDGHARRAVDAYAEFFGALVVSQDTRGEHARWTHLSTAALYRGTRVDVWTHVAVHAITPEVTA